MFYLLLLLLLFFFSLLSRPGAKQQRHSSLAIVSMTAASASEPDGSSGLSEASVPQDVLLKLADERFLAMTTSDAAEAGRLRESILAQAKEKSRLGRVGEWAGRQV